MSSLKCVFLENMGSSGELQYTLGKKLGSGTYAKVRAAWSQRENKMIAIKIIQKDRATKEFLEKFLPREMRALQSLQHPNILSLYRLVETPRQVYFMLEMAQNGDLLDYINYRRGLPEPQARFVLRSIASGISHCHARGIVHRDLKCENIMLTRDMEVKIGDFGFARGVDDKGTGVSTPCGSFSYAAPELFSGGLGSTYNAKKADVWSMGCILYAMVCGRLPFGDDSQVAKNVTKQINFPVPLTEDCKNIIQFRILTTDVKARCGVDQLHLCQWMRGPTSSLTPYRKTLHTEENCLPRVSQPQTSHTAECSIRYTDSPQESAANPLRIHAQTQGLPSAAAEGRTASTGTTTPTSWAAKNNSPTSTEVHRRKISAMERVEQRMRALNDPATSTVVLHCVAPPSSLPAAATGGGGMRARISSARKKVFQTFVQHSSSRSFSSDC